MGIIKLWTNGIEFDSLIEIFKFVHYELVSSPSLAEYLLYPRGLRTNSSENELAEMQQFHDLARHLGKKLLLFLISDEVVPSPATEHAIVYRLSMLRSQQLSHERILPFVWEGRSAAFKPITNPHPKIGFCGALTHPDRIRMLEMIKQICSSFIIPEFIVREQSWGQGITNAAEEFWDNLEQCEFAACPRGCGNFSIRFYQALSGGRIPVIVDTDIVLPFDFEIPWNEIAVLSPSLEELPANLSRFVKFRDVIEAQRLCRTYYDRYLSTRGFATQLEKGMRTGRL